MSTIFISYRRTDSPQACRVYDWLVRRFGHDAVFMDVAAIPVAVDFQEYIGQAIGDSRIMIALIGAQWFAKIQDDNDPVRLEIESALSNQVPVLPVLIGTTPMPSPDQLPASISNIVRQNAPAVGVSLDFDSHMQALLPKIESILSALAIESVVVSDPHVVSKVCAEVTRYLRTKFGESDLDIALVSTANWLVIGTGYFSYPDELAVTLFLHRVVRLGQLLDLHFILSFWSKWPESEQVLTGWVMRQLEQTPLIPEEIGPDAMPREWVLKIRPSDEDPRQIWKMITDTSLRLSLAYVATVSPKRVNESTSP